MAESDALDPIAAAIRAAFPDERGKRLLLELEARPGGEAAPHALSVHCVICRRRWGSVGASRSHHSTPFFGAAGGWLEAGGVRFVCVPCLEGIVDRFTNDPLDPGMVHTEVLRAIEAAGHGERSDARAELDRRIARPSLLVRRTGACTYCERDTSLAGSWATAMCLPCAEAALLALRK